MVITYKRKLNLKRLIEKKGNNNIEYFLPNAKYFYSSAVRLGLLDVFSSLNIKSNEYVLIPPICPQGIIIPLNKKRVNYDFYHLVDFFKIDLDSINIKIKQKNIVAIFFIHYFGKFNNQIYELKKICEQNNILLFEDGVHGLLSQSGNNNQIGTIGDISFFSFPKLLPVVDGAIFIVNNNEITLKFNTKFSLNILMSNFFHLLSLVTNNIYSSFNSKLYFKIFKFTSLFFYAIYYKLLCIQNTNVFISNISRKILSSIDYSDFINQKRFLFSLYLKNIDPCVIDKEINMNFLTWTGFPIFNSESVISKLKKEFKESSIETLSYVKSWNYMPKSIEFKNEMKLLNGHLLLPYDERIISLSSLEQKDFFNKLNNIICKHVNPNSSFKF